MWEGVMMSRKLNSGRKPISQGEVHSPERGDSNHRKGEARAFPPVGGKGQAQGCAFSR